MPYLLEYPGLGHLNTNNILLDSFVCHQQLTLGMHDGGVAVLYFDQYAFGSTWNVQAVAIELN